VWLVYFFAPGFKKKFQTAVTWHLFDIRQFEGFLISVRHEFSAFFWDRMQRTLVFTVVSG
jgi:hypothetical protein